MTSDSSDSVLFPPERRQQIFERAKVDGRVDVGDLSAHFNVTTETVRRDLMHLESAGLVTRVHGGAVPSNKLVAGVAERSHTMLPQKRAIARAALAELPRTGSVIVDAGTTTSWFAGAMPADRELTVLTNSIDVASTVLESTRVNLVLLGGAVSRQTGATSDMWAVGELAEVSVDVAFLGTTGLSVTNGLTTANGADGAVKKAMVRAARRVVVLADSSKIDVDKFFIFAGLDEIDVLVTDPGITAEQSEALAAAGVRVRVSRGPSGRQGTGLNAFAE